MKILGRTLAVCMLLACGCLWSAGNVAAKVCFVGDPDCAGGADFGDYVDPAADGDLCKQEGYILKADCDANPAKHVTGFCPYNSDYVMCCGKEYTYDACVYPHMPAGKCGKKYRCVCDPAKYPYTESQCHSSFKFSNPGGTACTQIDPGPTDTVKTLYYSACLCERGLYPYSKQDCQETANADVNGDPCVDSQGNSYWDSCKCSNPPYVWESIDCEFGGKGKACVQGGVYFFKECCSCAAFPAEGERGGRPNDVHATKWTTCDCPRKGRFKITQCAQGWQPNRDGSACERISCENAVKLFFSKDENKRRYSSYAVFTGNKLVHYAALTEAEKARLPEAQQTYAVGAEIAATSASTGVLAKNVSVASKYCSTGYEMGCTKAASIYSGAYFGTLSSTADHKMLQEACGSYEPEKTVVPVISFSGSTFPNTNSRTTGIYLYGAELKFSGTVNVNRAMYLYNTNLSGSGAVFNKTVNLSGDRAKPNGEDVTFKMSSVTFKNRLTSSNYSYNFGTIYLEVPASYKNSMIASFSLSEGQQFKGNNLYLYPTTDSYRNGNNTFPQADNWGTYVNFYGPSSSVPAEVYTSAYIGYYGSKRARNMSIRLNGNVRWNMYLNSVKYYIGLTPGSNIVSNNYGSGNYPRLVFGTNVYKSQCSMLTNVDYVVNRHKFLSCACKRWDNDASFYVSCAVNTSGTSTSGMYYSKTKVSNRHKGDCGDRGTYINPNCSVSYDCGRDPFSLLTCS